MNPWDFPTAFLVRHGTTSLNSSNCWRGWENPSLNEEGIQAAEAIQNYFQWQKLGRVICSDLNRAVETAEYIMESGSVTCPFIEQDPGLRSWAIGSFAGMKKTDTNKKTFQRYIDNPDERTPNTDELPGESLNEFRQRNERLLEYIHSPHQGLPSAIVVHTSNITAIQRYIDEIEGREPKSDEESIDMVEPGGIIAVYADTNGKLTMVPVLGEVEVEETPEVS
jgi:broad specificity phosphatase PhoE